MKLNLFVYLIDSLKEQPGDKIQISMRKHLLLEIKGGYRDIGNAIGESFKKEITEDIEIRKTEIPNYNSYLEKSREYYEYTRTVFPNLIEETESIAKSAGVGVLDYFFVNNREVYDEAEDYDMKQAVNPDRCTIAVGFGKEGAVVGHNEDWSIDSLDNLYILKAKINEITFISLNYKTAIAGVSASMNNFGLVQCINDLYQTNQFGVPKNYLARAILECKSLDEAEKLIRKTKRASGFNHVLVQGNEVRNIEIAGDQMSVEETINTPYVHTNHYTSPEMKHLEKFHTKSSEERYQRASELVKNVKTTEDMRRLLSDTQNKEYPICREDETIGSVIAIPENNELWTCYGHPCAGEFNKYEI